MCQRGQVWGRVGKIGIMGGTSTLVVGLVLELWKPVSISSLSFLLYILFTLFYTTFILLYPKFILLYTTFKVSIISLWFFIDSTETVFYILVFPWMSNLKQYMLSRFNLWDVKEDKIKKIKNLISIFIELMIVRIHFIVICTGIWMSKQITCQPVTRIRNPFYIIRSVHHILV